MISQGNIKIRYNFKAVLAARQTFGLFGGTVAKRRAERACGIIEQGRHRLVVWHAMWDAKNKTVSGCYENAFIARQNKSIKTDELPSYPRRRHSDRPSDRSFAVEALHSLLSSI